MPRKVQEPKGAGPMRSNLSLPAVVRRMANLRIGESGENLTGYIARLIREDWKRSGGRTDDERLRPQETEKQ